MQCKMDRIYYVLAAFLYLQAQAHTSDHGVLIFGGEGPEGLLDTVSVLTEHGWCPQDKVLLPPLPMAATGLTAYHGYENENVRPFIVVCGFPGESACSARCGAPWGCMRRILSWLTWSLLPCLPTIWG